MWCFVGRDRAGREDGATNAGGREKSPSADAFSIRLFPFPHGAVPQLPCRLDTPAWRDILLAMGWPDNQFPLLCVVSKLHDTLTWPGHFEHYVFQLDGVSHP
jgi:hypothetical protein